MRYNDFNGDNLVAALAWVLRALDAALAHAEFLPALRAGRNLELGAAIDGRDVDFGTQRRLGTVTGTVS